MNKILLVAALLPLTAHAMRAKENLVAIKLPARVVFTTAYDCDAAGSLRAQYTYTQCPYHKCSIIFRTPENCPEQDQEIMLKQLYFEHWFAIHTQHSSRQSHPVNELVTFLKPTAYYAKSRKVICPVCACTYLVEDLKPHIAQKHIKFIA